MAPQSANQVQDYEDGFAQAARFTRSLGFTTTGIELGDQRSDVLDRNGKFIDPVFAAAGVVDPAQAAGQCLKWCHYLRPHYERQLGRRVILTIGQLWKQDICVFGPSFKDLARWVHQGLQIEDVGEGDGFKLHAWLTVETGEIIEPTLLSSLAAFGHPSFRPYAGATVWGRDPNVLNAHRYVPLAIGGEIVEQIHNRSFVPLLASEPAELPLQAYAFFSKL